MRTATMLALLVALGAAGGDAQAQTFSNLNLRVCNQSSCTFEFDFGPGVVTSTITGSPVSGSLAGTDLSITPAEFSPSGDPECDFTSFAQVTSFTPSFVSTTGFGSFFDQDQLVQHVNPALTQTTTAVIDYSMNFTLLLTGNASPGSFTNIETQWFFAEEGLGGTFVDSGVSGLAVNSEAIVVQSFGHHQGDIQIVDMGGGFYEASGSGSITLTSVPLNTTPRIGVGIFPSAHLEAESGNAAARVMGPAPTAPPQFARAPAPPPTGAGPAMGTAAGLQFRLRPIDPDVTITAIPVPEPIMPGYGALLVLAALARRRRRA